jgi:hypothetical protein
VRVVLLMEFSAEFSALQYNALRALHIFVDSLRKDDWGCADALRQESAYSAGLYPEQSRVLCKFEFRGHSSVKRS